MNPHAHAAPSAWVRRFAHLVESGPVLDLACGGGRHTRLFAERELNVIALDRDAQAIAALQNDAALAERVQACVIDLEVAPQELAWPCAPRSLGAVVVTNYLHRPLFERLFASLAEDGLFIMETFAAGNGEFGKPSNPDFLLQPGELLQILQAQGDMRVLAYEDGYVLAPKEAMVQRICARKGGFGARPGLLGPL
ncbi:class I SAM-dependent methyltransferase [Massilia sp. W12]|uniref:class I SAM-dependent methyltransferase n=1 Tax=Massilia sp. W12 TaxID=3126507 RepID=UPI0030CCB893